MPQGVSVVRSPDPGALSHQTSFRLVDAQLDRSCDVAPRQAEAFQEGFRERVIGVGRVYGLDVVEDSESEDEKRIRIEPRISVEEVEQFGGGTIWVDIRLRVDVRDENARLLETVELRDDEQSTWGMACAGPDWWV